MGINLASIGTAQWLVIALCVALGVWFLVGMAVNRRRGTEVCRRLTSELSGYTATAVRWVDLATAAIGFRAAGSAPVDRAEVVVAMERRENCPLWLFQHLAGTRDKLILRAALRTKTSLEAHVIPVGDLVTLTSLTENRQPPLRALDAQDGFRFLVGGSADDGSLQKLRALVRRLGPHLLRMTVRPETPQMSVQLSASGLLREPPGALPGLIGEIAESVAQ